MDLSFSAEEEAFRQDVRSFLTSDLPDWLSAKVRSGKRLTKRDYETWHAALARRGWLGTLWPKDHGGPGWGPVERHIFDEEAIRAGAPRIVPFGVNMLGPVLIQFGTDAQKARYLPRILDGTDWWCQGYSEPGAGSDLASLTTKAVRDGDHYVVNGQKTWTTLGQHADWIFCLVRTSSDGKPQEGISFLLIDMATPGVEIRPIVLLDGEHEVNEVFLTDVRVPAENLVGAENQGWTIAKYLLTHERTGLAGLGFSTAALANLKSVAGRELKGGKPLIQDPVFGMKVAEAEIELDALRTTVLRTLAAAKARSGAGAAPGPEAGMLKIKGTVIRQRITELTRQALGPFAAPYLADALDDGSNVEPVGPDGANPVASQYFNLRKLSIFGGSNEIQRNIIAKELLDR